MPTDRLYGFMWRWQLSNLSSLSYGGMTILSGAHGIQVSVFILNTSDFGFLTCESYNVLILFLFVDSTVLSRLRNGLHVAY
jgi:hypothetical protein